MVFSHCWPQALTAPFAQPLWRIAEALGGNPTTTYSTEQTTHVVREVYSKGGFLLGQHCHSLSVVYLSHHSMIFSRDWEGWDWELAPTIASL